MAGPRFSARGQRIGSRYQDDCDGRQGYLTLFGEGDALRFAANGLWVEAQRLGSTS